MAGPALGARSILDERESLSTENTHLRRETERQEPNSIQVMIVLRRKIK